MEEDEAARLSEWEQVRSPFPPWDIEALHIDDHFPSHDHREALSTSNPQTESPLPLPLPLPQQEPRSPPSSSASSSPTPAPESPPPPPPPATSSSNLQASGAEAARRRLSSRGAAAAREIAARLRLRLRVLSAEFLRLASKAMIAGRFWSVAGVVAAFLLSLLYRRLRSRWRPRALPFRDDKERLVVLLREKDEKIGQLMVQVAEMNEALSARRRVPVIRVG